VTFIDYFNNKFNAERRIEFDVFTINAVIGEIYVEHFYTTDILIVKNVPIAVFKTLLYGDVIYLSERNKIYLVIKLFSKTVFDIRRYSITILSCI